MRILLLHLCFIFSVLSFGQNIDFSSATKFEAGQTISGSVNTQPLFYKTLLPVHGTMKIVVNARNSGSTDGYLKAEVYDSRQSDLLLSKNVQKTDVAPGENIADTLTISCRAIETIFLKVSTTAEFSFELYYEMEDAAGSEPESNDSPETAVTSILDTTYTGTIGYLNAGIRDGEDFYKFDVSTGGKFSVYLEGVHTGDANGQIEAIFYQVIDGHYMNEEKRMVIKTSSALPGETVQDSLILDCIYLYGGPVYVKIVANSCFIYSLRMTHNSMEPTAEFTYQKMGNNVQFNPALSDVTGTDFYWRFGTEMIGIGARMMGPTEEFFETSTSPYPFISMPIGNHRVSLEVNTKDCGLYDQVIQHITIQGVEDYFPKKASVGGDFNLMISGAGFNSNTEVTIRKDATTIGSYDMLVNAEGLRLNAFFDFHLAQPGFYDVIINVPGVEEPYIFENGLEVTSIIYPETFSEIAGPDIWRTGSGGSLSLMVHNRGSVMASGVVAALVWPKDIEVSFQAGALSTSRHTGNETVVVDGETFSLPRADYMYIYDSLDAPTPIEMFNMKPYDGYVKYILIPHVPASGYVEIPFVARSLSGEAGKVKFHTYTFKTNQQGSCDNPVYSNFNENLTAELIDGMDMVIDQTGVVPLKVLSKTAKIGQKHAGSMSSYYGKKFWAWYDGYEFDQEGAMRDWLAETEANNAFALQTATDELGSLVFKKASAQMIDRYKGQVEFINKRLAANPNMSAKLTDKYLDKLNSLPHGQMRRLEALTGMFDEVRNLATLSDKLLKLQTLIEECPELAPQLEDLVKDLEKELNIRDPKEKESELRNSFDPNMISGPSGIGTNRYLNNTDPQTFTISFENLETATAAAQIVKIYDTLDVSKYDVSTFSFGSIGIGNKYFRLPPGRKEFAIERNIEQEIPVKVRISGSVNDTTGVITWLFVAIDTTTGMLPVLDGFLPPNINYPEGEGFVRFTVKPKSNLPDGTLFENQANIYFDQNEPIRTNVWRNTLDIGKPASTLMATVSQDTLIQLDLTGFDAVSGVGYYDLYVKVNNGPWTSFGRASSDSIVLIGEPDSTYSFYVKSFDRVGNEEDKNAGAEATVTIQRPLAVTFGSLSAQNIGRTTNRLQWNTYGEDRDDFFVVERSKDGASFSQIDKVNAKGRPSLYEYFDRQPMEGNNYYRLKIVNNTGTISYSDIAVAKVAVASRISAFPNPVSGKLTVQIPGSVHHSEKLILFNSYGQKVVEQAVTAHILQIEMKHLPAGIYHLMYKSKNGKEEKLKIMKK